MVDLHSRLPRSSRLCSNRMRTVAYQLATSAGVLAPASATWYHVSWNPVWGRAGLLWAASEETMRYLVEKIRYLSGVGTSVPIFVIGTGRSGTHWVGYILAAHPDIRATIEAAPIFQWVTTMALNPQTEAKLLPRLIRAYKWQRFRSAPRHYLDKSHPNIWIAEHLKKAFPDALFVGIERNPYATVASMMKHEGVAAWHERSAEFPIPNRFLGIVAERAATYDQIPLAGKCAIRWIAHRAQMERLRESLGDSLLVVSYESLIQNTREEIDRLQSFLNLSRPIPMPEVKRASLDKWRAQLSAEQIQDIAAVVDFGPP